MLEEILGYLNNWFVPDGGIHVDTYAIEDGSISLPFLSDGQYFRIVGSTFNDGVHKYPTVFPQDETFRGAVWALAIPNAVIDMAVEVEAWEEKNAEKASGLYQSESFGGYSYTLKSGGDSSNFGWQSAFAGKLNRWRKI